MSYVQLNTRNVIKAAEASIRTILIKRKKIKLKLVKKRLRRSNTWRWLFKWLGFKQLSTQEMIEYLDQHENTHFYPYGKINDYCWWALDVVNQLLDMALVADKEGTTTITLSKEDYAHVKDKYQTGS